eukprot:4033275-Pleurochrysis_carterae.AAC.1
MSDPPDRLPSRRAATQLPKGAISGLHSGRIANLLANVPLELQDRRCIILPGKLLTDAQTDLFDAEYQPTC